MTRDESLTYEINLATLFDAVAERVPDRPAVVHRGVTRSFAELNDRVRRLARYLERAGLGCHTERANLPGHTSGQDLLAQYLHNGSEYIEGTFGAFRARVAPFNVNYRYVPEELVQLFADAHPRAIQFHARYGPVLAEVLSVVGTPEVLLQVDDGSGCELLPGAVDYEAALASVAPEPSAVPSPDDLYVLYTGGTTGRPKGVLWRQGDVAVGALQLIDRRRRVEWSGLPEQLASVGGPARRLLASAPFMHGAAQWGWLQALCEGNTVVIQRDVDRLDAADIWDTVEQERVDLLTIVGDSFARPLLDELERVPRDVSSLRFITSGGAALQPANKDRLVAAVPGLRVVDGMGSSESGSLGRANTDAGHRDTPARLFEPSPGTTVVADDLSRVLEPGHDGIGWLATRGRIPLGYLGDAAKSASTFPVIDGKRFSVPGDRARLLPEGLIEVLGRDSVTINTGGEKVFAEEVEAAVKAHPRVADTVVCGRPSERWGSEVVAIVASRDGGPIDPDELLEECARHLARYKLPKAVILVPEVKRNPNGKADYRWAVQIATNPQ